MAQTPITALPSLSWRDSRRTPLSGASAPLILVVVPLGFKPFIQNRLLTWTLPAPISSIITIVQKLLLHQPFWRLKSTLTSALRALESTLIQTTGRGTGRSSLPLLRRTRASLQARVGIARRKIHWMWTTATLSIKITIPKSPQTIKRSCRIVPSAMRRPHRPC